MKLQNIALLSVLFLQSCALPYQHPKTSSIDKTFEDDFSHDFIKNYVANNPIEVKNSPGSLWQNGSNGFFKDNRAKQVGDIITVSVQVDISAETSANTATTHKNNSKSGISKLLNLTDNITHQGIGIGAGELFDTESDRSFAGSGKTDRKDTLKTTIAATVIQVLPNGHMVIKGKREVSINYEMQELQIAGIIRPEDVSANNLISSNKIAQARISYGGKGNIDEVQTKKWGVKFLDRWMPF